jgi:hypothetical protein
MLQELSIHEERSLNQDADLVLELIHPSLDLLLLSQ